MAAPARMAGSHAMGVSWVVRSVRAAVFAVVCVLLAAGGHTLATGAVPPTWVDTAVFLPVFAGGAALAGRERSLLGIAVAMLVVQGGLHLAFDAAGPPDAPATHMPGMPHGMHMAAPSQAMTSHTVAAHLAAALLASWCLRRGEAALWSLLRKAVAFVPGLAAWWRTAPLPAYARPPRPYAHRRHHLRQVVLRHALSRRGPPLGSPYSI
ncbi:hypothetical protein ACFOZ0_16210 [Streptomyces yaanensis]|uniref:Integral membrane protein n=1 Tax=Streptomyces yaanensis TaxID=1142239 RepID=A0ABV7SCV6_9ACTN|nr:hypothetical protein [Streptomyces sp. CGMCC 4.7035]WNB98395.1 hypothetical protein Q2K21_10090 [Streptomyces sp. CGMCC 4.7035]